jgi:hypothetical protein
MHDTPRTQLATARARKRTAQDTYNAAKRAIKRRMINEAGGWKGIGTNDKEREILLDLAVEDNTACQIALAELRHWEQEVDRLQALVDDEIDTRRMVETGSRDRLSHALERLGIRRDEEADAVTVLATPTHRTA